MSIALYLAPQIGSGTYSDPYRSMLNDLINIISGDWFDEIDHPIRRVSICCVHASDATHSAIALNSQVVRLSSLMPDNLDFASKMDMAATSLPTDMQTAIVTALEAKGINTAWMSAATTLRELVAMLLRVCQFAQRAEGNNNAALKILITANLDSTFGSFTTTRRNAIKTWMASKGLATGWITNSSTVRQIIHFIMMNMGWPKLRLSGELF